MLRRPSARRKDKAQIALNLVPILDAMVTLIAFLLFTSSFFAIVAIESPAPVASSEVNEQALKEKPLQLTLTIREKESEIWSPFDKIAAKTIQHTEPGKPDIKLIHEALLAVKQQFPTETKIVLVPNSTTNYDTLIAVMDTMRLIEATDTPIFAKNAQTGNDEPLKLLFPDIVFGNLLAGDS